LIYQLIGLIVLAFVVYVGYSFELIPLTSFFILIILFSRIYPLITTVNTDLNRMISQFASVKLVMTLDDEFAEPDMESHKKIEPLPLDKEIELNHLSFGYEKAQNIFENFSANIPAYHMVGIIGESGKGKTTLLDIIAGLQKPHSGEILIDGQKLDLEKWAQWRNGIGYLPQDSFFIDGSLRENLIWDCRRKITDKEIKTVLRQVNGLSLVNRFKDGLDEQIVNYSFHFSGGERQRLALARVLLREPQILLLDEATSSLDAKSEKQIMELLVSLKEKITILVVTHKTSVTPWLDKIITLHST
jgi:ATP-binding cassette subfamily C protein